MGSIFLDITKDRQYTMKASSLPRRSAQTAAYHILNALVRWMYPVLSFTGEEIWQEIPGNKEDYAALSLWYDKLVAFDDKEVISKEDWQTIFTLREAVSKQLEVLRKEDKIGASLTAIVNIECGQETFVVLSKLEDELRFVLITSGATVSKAEVGSEGAVPVEGLNSTWISAKKSDAEKCVRCWHFRDDVGENSEHPELCLRCVENVSEDGEGESRHYA